MSAKPTYRIRDWSEHFENHETRKLRNLRFVSMPNRQDGKGYRRLAAHPRSPEAFAAWVLIVEVASKMRERGLLEDEDGPIDALDLAAMTGFPAAIFELAFEVLTDTKIGWLEAVNPPENSNESPEITPQSPGNSTNNGAISRGLPENTPFFGLGGEGRGGKGISVAERPAEPPLDGDVEAEFPCVGGQVWALTTAKANEYRQSFPLVDVGSELRKALQWCRDNPNRRKTPRGMPAFLGRWLAKAQAEAEAKRPGDESPKGTTRMPTEEDAAAVWGADERVTP